MANPWDSDPVVGGKTSTPEEFAQVYGPAAERAGKTLGVDPKVILGQWGLETGWGKSIVPGTNNLGNIKDFAGGGVEAKDNMTGSRDKYRAYSSPEEFADDYSSLIQRKYPDALGAKDPMAFAKALKAGGYAEDPRYVDKVAQAARMAGTKTNPVVAAVGKAVEAVVPPAQASGNPWDNDPIVEPAKPAQQPESRGFVDSAVDATKNLAGGALRGAAGIGSTLLAPTDYLSDKIAGRPGGTANKERRQSIDDAVAQFSDPNSINFQAGKIGTEIAGTAGAGGALAAPMRAAAPVVSRAAPAVGNALSRLATATQSGGMVAGQGGNLLTRAAGGAISGAAQAGLVNPEDAGTGALIGGALPVAAKAAGATGNALGRALRGGQMSPEVQKLAQRANQLGIDIPADRLVDSKPLNAIAASLDYVPFSGRAATMNKMEDQLNTAVSKTFGQNNPNIAKALRDAESSLGAKFEQTLSQNKVKVDNKFLQDLVDATQTASKELGSDSAQIIKNQVDEILAKAGQTGEIDGQAAYNIKKALDRIGRRNSNEAYYATDLKQKLMEALDRSLGPQEAAAFAKTRKQYGNMLALEKIVPNGAESGVSIARLANMKNINNPELKELADISAQFLKSREGQHGAAQRAGVGAITAALTGLPGLAAGVGIGRGTNMLLNSSAAKNALLGQSQANRLLQLANNPQLQQLGYRTAPVLGAQ